METQKDNAKVGPTFNSNVIALTSIGITVMGLLWNVFFGYGKLIGRIEGMENDISDMKVLLFRMDDRMNRFEIRMDRFQERMDRFEERMDKRFLDFEEKVDKRFLDFEEKMDKRFQDLEDKMDKRFVRVEAKIDALQADVHKLDIRVTAIEKRKP